MTLLAVSERGVGIVKLYWNNFRNNRHQKEFENYARIIGSVGGVSSTVDMLEWWKGHEQELPHWVAAFKLIALIQPSSAACERVFSSSDELLL